MLKGTLIQTLIYTLAIVINKGLGLWLNPYYISVFGDVSSYGVFSYVYITIAFSQVILAVGQETNYFRKSGDARFKDRRIEGEIFSIHLAVCLLFCLVLCAGSYWVAKEVFQDESLQPHTLLLGGILAADLLAIIPFAQLRKQGRAIRFASLKLLGTGIHIAVMVGCFALKERGSVSFLESWDTLYIVLFANCVGSTVVFLLLARLWVRYRITVTMSLWKPHLLYGFPLMISGLAFIINEMADGQLIKLLMEPWKEPLGIYRANYKVITLLGIAITGYRLGVEPFFFARSKESERNTKLVAVMMQWMVGLLCFCSLLILANTELVFEFFLDSNEVLRSGMHILPILCLAYIFSAMYQNLSIWYKLSDKTIYGMWFSSIGATITISGNLLLIPVYGFTACAWVTLLCYVSIALVSYGVGKKKYPIPYNLSRIVGYLTFALFLYLVGIYSERFPVSLANFLSFCFLAVFGVLEYKQIKQFIGT